MKLTNRYGLPQVILDAIRNDPYDAGESDVTCTQLVGPPQMARISREHWTDIEEDATDRIWALWGQAMHAIIQRAAPEDLITEKRYFATIEGRQVSGQVDLLYPLAGHLEDWKVVSTWKFSDGIPWVYEAQVNVLAYLCDLNGITIRSAAIGAFYRDWIESRSNGLKAYPRKPVEMFDIHLWDKSFTQQFVVERIQDYFAPIVRPCTDEERWYRGEEFAVLKAGRKTAAKVTATYNEAITWMVQKGIVDVGGEIPHNYEIEHRPGQYIRCQRYCPAAKWCPQWQADVERGIHVAMDEVNSLEEQDEP